MHAYNVLHTTLAKKKTYITFIYKKNVFIQ